MVNDALEHPVPQFSKFIQEFLYLIIGQQL